MIAVLINDHQTIICTAIGWECGRLCCRVYIGMKWGWIIYILVDGNEIYIGNVDGIIWYIQDGVGVCVGDIVGVYIDDEIGLCVGDGDGVYAGDWVGMYVDDGEDLYYIPMKELIHCWKLNWNIHWRWRWSISDAGKEIELKYQSNLFVSICGEVCNIYTSPSPIPTYNSSPSPIHIPILSPI